MQNGNKLKFDESIKIASWTANLNNLDQGFRTGH